MSLRNSESGKTKTLDVSEFKKIVERAESLGLPKKDCDTLRDLFHSLSVIQQELGKKDVEVARIQALFGLSGSEKLKDVAKKKSKSGGSSFRSTTKRSKKSKKSKKPKGHGRNGADKYKGADRVEVSHSELSPGDPCPNCPSTKKGKIYPILARELVQVTGQAPIHATIYKQEALRCNLCGDVFVAEPPVDIGETKYDERAASMIALLKYGSGLPFNRLQRLEGYLGIPLPTSTQWEIVSEAADKLLEVHEELIRQAAQGTLFHLDDTSMEITELRKTIKELDAKGKARRTGIFTTGIISVLADGHSIALYITGQKHAGENLTDVLGKRVDGLEPPLHMCDALSRNMPKELETIIANCLAHARRKFVQVIGAFPDESLHILEEISLVYKHDAEAKELGLDDAQRLLYHQKNSGPVIDRLRKWMDEQFQKARVEPNSSLGAPIQYMTKRWGRLTRFLEKEGAPLDNNLVERALKTAILHRKNAYFYKTQRGARVGDLFMSLTKTATMNGVNPYLYLTSLLKNAESVKQDPARWMPWSCALDVDLLIPSHN